jgi:3' exoribonuclease, RNase T-like
VTIYDYDLEFLEDGRTIELISIGIVCEDGREYYAVNREAPWKRIAKHPWLMDNVVPNLPRLHGDERLHRWILSRSGRRWNPCMLDFPHPHMRPRDVIADEVRDFLLSADRPVLWADYGAYDHVALCHLWGPMVALPEGLPMFTCDIQQEAQCLGIGWDELPEQASGVHNALADARHVGVKREFLAALRGGQQ